MPELCKSPRFIFRRSGIRSAHDNIINIQIRLAHIQRCRSQRRDVVLKGCELQRDFIGLFIETLQLLGNRLGSGDLVSLLSAVCHHVIHDLIQSLGFQIHRLHDFRIVQINLIVSVLIRICSGIHQYLSVDLVQPVGGILQLLKYRSKAAQCCLHAKRVASLGQINIIRIPFLISKLHIFPVIAVAERYFFQFLEQYFAVYVYRSVRDASSCIILTSLDHNIVITILRHFKIPLNPLSRTSPRFSAYIVQDCSRHAIRLCCRGRPVILCIERGFRPECRCLALYNLTVVSCPLRSVYLRLFCKILVISIYIPYRAHCQFLQEHRFVFAFKRNAVCPLLKIKFVRFRNVPHIIPEVSSLPIIDLHLRRADFIPLIVYSHLSAIRPDSGERDIPCILKRNLSIDIHNAFRGNSSRLRKKIFYIKVIEAALRHINLPCNHRAGSGKQYLSRALIVLLYLHIASRGIGKQIHIPTLRRVRSACMVTQISCIGSLSLHACNFHRKIRSRILLMKILHIAHRKKDSNHRYHCHHARCHNHLLNRAFHSFLQKIQYNRNLHIRQHHFPLPIIAYYTKLRKLSSHLLLFFP